MVKRNEILNNIRTYAEQKLVPTKFIPGETRIPASGAIIAPDDVVNVSKAVLQFWYTDYKMCSAFRRELSKFTGLKHVTLCNSGSSANLIAASACFKKKKGKYVITTATGFSTTVGAIYQSGKIPIYVDIDPYTLSPNIHQIKHYLSAGGIAGGLFTHTMGFPFRESEVASLFPNGTMLVIDSCDALGAEIDGYKVGKYADAMTLSFFPAHHIFSGEGGAVLTNNPKLSKIIDSYGSWGRDCWCKPGQSNTCGKRFDWNIPSLPPHFDHKYIFSRVGYNTKMTEFQAALGASQIKRLPGFIKKRLRNFVYLLLGMRKFSEFFDFVVPLENSKPSPFGFPIIRKDSAPFETSDIIIYLEEHKIATRRMFGGNMTRQPAFAELDYLAYNLAGSNKVLEDMFWVGCWHGITVKMMDYMLYTVEEFLREKGLL